MNRPAASRSVVVDDLSAFDLLDAMENSIGSCCPLVSLFYHSSQRRGGAVDGENDSYETNENSATINQRRDAICGVMHGFDRASARRLFGGMIAALSRVVKEESYLPPHYDSDVEGNDVGMGRESNFDLKADAIVHSIRFLGCCADLVGAYLKGILSRDDEKLSASGKYENKFGKRIDVINEAYEAAGTLHDLLFPLQGLLLSTRSSRFASSRSQSSIFTMCETWWHGSFVHRERMVTQLVPLLLIRCLSDDAKRDDVIRLCSVRRAIDLLDFDDASIASLKRHLLRTVGSPLFLKYKEGRQFIMHLFQVDASFVCDVHGAVKVQIPGSSKKALEKYAEIYYYAWKESTEMTTKSWYEYNDDDDDETCERRRMSKIQSSIEKNALQGLMYLAMHAASPSTSRSGRIVLDKFFLNKKSPDVESMLHRTYGPLLWRGITSASSIVRVRSASVLADTFPLRDPNAENGTKAVVKSSVCALVGLMEDLVPSVRVAGSVATARVLSHFWAMIPIEDIRMLLNQIIAVHASDVSTIAVRAAAVDAVSILLEEDRAHAVLRPLLPSIGNLIHDSSDKVRLSVIKMLLHVKRIRELKYYHVVPASHLIARLAEEGCDHNDPSGLVAQSLSELLSNSFFPSRKSGVTMTDIVNRTMRLFADNPMAAIVFYRNAHLQLSVNSISKLITALAKCLCFLVIEEKRMNGEDVSSLLFSIPEAGSIQFKGGRIDTLTMANIAEGRSILWESIEAKLEVSKKEALAEVFSGAVLLQVYRHFESKFAWVHTSDVELTACSRACTAILRCAGKLEGRQCEELRSHIVNELHKTRDLPMKQRITINLIPSIVILCQWGMTDDVVSCLASSIRLYFEGENLLDSFMQQNPHCNGTQKLMPLDIDVCIGILGHILKGSHSASAYLRNSILESEIAFDTILSALLSANSAVERMMNGLISLDGELSLSWHIGTCIECYGRLMIHKSATTDNIPVQLNPALRSLLIWATDTAFPSLVEPLGQDYTLDLNLSRIASRDSMNTAYLGDLSFMDEIKFNKKVEKNFSSTQAAIIICSASSVIRTLAEWLSIRLVADSFVTEQMSKLCRLLACTDPPVRKALSGVLFHAAIICLKIGDEALFVRVLLSMKNLDHILTEEEIAAYTISIVSAEGCDMTAIIFAIQTIVCQANNDPSMAITPFIDKIGKFMWNILLHSMKRSSLLLAQCLVNEPKAWAVSDLLLKELDDNSHKSHALEKVLLRWASENQSDVVGSTR